MVLEYAQKYEQPLCVVPVGLNYMHREKWRSRVIVVFGKPVETPKHLLDTYNPNTPEGFAPARELTKIYEDAVAPLAINAPDWATLRYARTFTHTQIYTLRLISLAACCKLRVRFTFPKIISSHQSNIFT
jgi:hypothetical protein